MNILRYFAFFEWSKTYSKDALRDDAGAAVIVTIMLIPQSLAYALLAGLPPQIGLYASIAPLIAYTIFGTSRALAVGPVAVISLMTAAAVSQIAAPGSAEYIGAALILSMMSGLFLLLMGVFRLGFIANLLSHPVITGFITGAGILIAASQMKHILGVSASGHTLPAIVHALSMELQNIHALTMMIGFSTILFLYFIRRHLKNILKKLGARQELATAITRAGPVLAVILTTCTVLLFKLDSAGVKVVGEIPQGLPGLTIPSFDMDLWKALFPAALLISLIGFAESVSVGQTLAAKKRQQIDPDQELIGLGAANIASALTGGYPVTGGFARSVVNFDAGARTPFAGTLTALGILITTLFFTPLFAYLPIATLAGTIIVAVLSLIDVHAIKQTLQYSKRDFASMLATIIITLLIGVETGILAGMIISILLHLYRTSRPHVAVVGLVPGTQHFRNIKRHKVDCRKKILSIRIDESLYFANARYLEKVIYAHIAECEQVEHFILMCSAINEIDSSALESLETINHILQASKIKFHLSEVKGPVMDRLKRSDFLDTLTGEVFLCQYDAVMTLEPKSKTVKSLHQL